MPGSRGGSIQQTGDPLETRPLPQQRQSERNIMAQRSPQLLGTERPALDRQIPEILHNALVETAVGRILAPIRSFIA
ncbi:MAG: hypothetical protein CRU78_04620 [Candidatus Accumulibacter phosphatis]|uniref:Uncharacterized protein n=1 Tax=Candidatus Accumulibacter phosphatis TaxID=327160 RepID=A0A6A7RRX0_9PROT|nr:hypothetical protein [Candidatus Accumulibacter phosphatis]